MIASWKRDVSRFGPRVTGTLATSGMIALLGLISGTVAARWLGPEGRGELAQLLLWPQLFATVGNLGIDAATIYHSADRDQAGDAHATALTLGAAQACVLVPMYLIAAAFIFDGSTYVSAMIVAPLVVTYVIGAYSSSVLMGTLRFGAFNVVRAAIPFAHCALIVTLVAFDALSVRMGAIAFVAAHAAVDALAVAIAWRAAGIGVVRTKLARSMLSYGFRAQPGRLSPQSLGVETLIVALVLSSHDVGLFVAAVAMLMAPQIVVQSMSMIVFPSVSASRCRDGRSLLQAFAVYGAAVSAICAALALLAEPLVLVLFGDAFSEAVPALRLLAVAAGLRALRQFPMDVLRGIGRPGLASTAEAANWLLVLTIVPAAAAAGGLQGAAAGSVIVSGAGCLVLLGLVWIAGLLPLTVRDRARLSPAEVTT